MESDGSETLTLKETVGDEDDGVPSYFIRAVGACPPVTLNHHSHCRPYKLKLHLLPPLPFLLPPSPSQPSFPLPLSLGIPLKLRLHSEYLTIVFLISSQLKLYHSPFH